MPKADDSHGWRVGRLAQATGVTVRTPHHYEEVGVLVPSGRGHRVYADADVRRLYRITALRELGMSLVQIRDALDRGTGLAEVLRAREVVRAFTGGGPAMYASLERMYEGEEPEAASRGTMDADLMAYLRRAVEALPHTG